MRCDEVFPPRLLLLDVVGPHHLSTSIDLSKLLHPNVLLLMGVCIDKEAQELLMVTELMEHGSVFDLIHRRGVKLPFQQRMRIAKDCALGMNYLHLNKPSPILCVSSCLHTLTCPDANQRPMSRHLDLKSANLLVNVNYVTKVAGK